MSQREFLLVLAHAHNCTPCRGRLVREPAAVFTGRALTPEERETLERLQLDDFITPERLAKAAAITVAQIDEYKDHPVARLRHF